MVKHRFFIPQENIQANKLVISDYKQLHYMRDVLRLKAKDEVIAFDRINNEYIGMIEEASKDCISINIKQKRKITQDRGIRITIACAIPKARRIEGVVDKLTQLGIDRIIPLITKRVIVDWDQAKISKHLRRWNEIAVSAAQQSSRRDLPIIDSVQSIGEVLANSDTYDLKLIPTLEGKRKSLREVLKGSKAKSILVFIGPEGDFTDQEVRIATKSGCIPISLGDLVLRVETAAVAVASFIRFYK